MDEVKHLEGSWKTVSANFMGKPQTAKEAGMEGLGFAGDKFTVKTPGGGDGPTFSFTVDPSQKPKAMDWIKDKDKPSLPCIYSLDGDDLKICFPLLPSEKPKDGFMVKRPESFDPKDKPEGLITAKRVKP